MFSFQVPSSANSAQSHCVLLGLSAICVCCLIAAFYCDASICTQLSLRRRQETSFARALGNVLGVSDSNSFCLVFVPSANVPIITISRLLLFTLVPNFTALLVTEQRYAVLSLTKQMTMCIAEMRHLRCRNFFETLVPTWSSVTLQFLRFL